MFDPDSTDDDKLRVLRSDFESCVDHQDDAQEESHRAGRFYHNTAGEGQWESGDLEYLREEGRVAFTFNLVAPKVDTFVGMVTDAKRSPRPVPKGRANPFASEVLGAIQETINEVVGAEAIEGEVLKKGTIHREHSVRVEVERDPENPLLMKAKLESIPCYDLYWDSASRKADRRDARYLFWNRWLGKYEFQAAFPDADWDELVQHGGGAEGEEVSSDLDRSEIGDVGVDLSEDMYDRRKWNRYYWDDRRGKIRVIHAEYRIPKKAYFVVDEDAGLVHEVSKEAYNKLEDMKQAGLVRPEATGVTTYRDEIYTAQWVGPKIVKQGPLGQPYDGFSIVSFAFGIDSETGLAYGMLRNLFDPQMEVNKSHSLSLEQLAGQSAPGVIAEEGSINSADTFRDQMRTTGGVAFVAKGALSSNQVIERNTAQVSPGVSQRLEVSVSMIDKCSNVDTSPPTPAGQAEAFGTVQLRHRKTQLSMADVINTYEEFQKGVARRILQAIIRAMPDKQILDYLGKKETYVVQGRTIIEIDPTNGQPKMDPMTGQPANMVKLEELRTLHFEVGLEVSSANTTLRLLDLQALMALVERNQPVDPVVLIEAATASRSMRERLKAYAEKVVQAQSQQAQQQAQQAEQQVQTALMIEQSKAAEAARHNRVDEQLTAMKTHGDHMAKMASVLEKADEDEKRATMEFVRLLAEHQAKREAIIAQYETTGG